MISLAYTSGYDHAVFWVEDVTISAHLGKRLVPLPEGSRYLGFIFARAGSPDAGEAALRQSHAQLEFIIEPLNWLNRDSCRSSPDVLR